MMNYLLIRLFQPVIDALEILLFPRKSFKKVSQNPSFKGPLAILVFLILSNVPMNYVYLSKISVEVPLLNRTLIPSLPPYEISINLSFTPRQIGIYTYNWTTGSDIIIVYGRDIKQQEIQEIITINPNETIHYTEHYFTAVTKVRFNHGGDNKSQYLMLGSKPKNYSSLLMLGQFSSFTIRSSMSVIIAIFINWSIYSIFIFLVLKLFHENKISFSILLIVMGYALVPAIVYPIVRTIAILTLPELKFPLEVWASKSVESMNQIWEPWTSSPALQLVFYIRYVIDVWTLFLTVTATYVSFELDLKKAAIASLIAYGVRLLLANIFRMI